MYKLCKQIINIISGLLTLAIVVIILSFCVVLFMAVTASAYDLPNGGHMHQHIFSCYEGWETICTEEHVHYSNCYKGKGEVVCGMKEGCYYTVAQMNSLREKSPIVATVKKCRETECDNLFTALDRRPDIDHLVYQKGTKVVPRTLPYTARENFASAVKALSEDIVHIHKHSPKCFEDIHFFRVRYL